MTNEDMKFVFNEITNLLKPEEIQIRWQPKRNSFNLEKPINFEINLKNEFLKIHIEEDIVQIIGQNSMYTFNPKYILYLKEKINKLPKTKKAIKY